MDSNKPTEKKLPSTVPLANSQFVYVLDSPCFQVSILYKVVVFGLKVSQNKDSSSIKPGWDQKLNSTDTFVGWLIQISREISTLFLFKDTNPEYTVNYNNSILNFKFLPQISIAISKITATFGWLLFKVYFLKKCGLETVQTFLKLLLEMQWGV